MQGCFSYHGNGDYITYEYDLLDRPIRKVYYDSDHTVQAEYLYVYSADGQLAKQYAVSGGNVVEEYSFEYDSLGRLIRSREDKGRKTGDGSVSWEKLRLLSGDNPQ